MTRTLASATEKLLHWAVAVTVFVMLATGLVMYVPALSEAIGQRFWIRTTHMVGALAFVLVLVVIPVLRWPEIRRLERDLALWERADWDWFRRPWDVFLSEYRYMTLRTGRFNGGQKLLAALTAVALAVLLLTGIPMYWWGIFSAQLVVRSRELHLLAAFGLAALIAGHLYLALFSPYGLWQARAGRTGSKI